MSTRVHTLRLDVLLRDVASKAQQRCRARLVLPAPSAFFIILSVFYHVLRFLHPCLPHAALAQHYKVVTLEPSTTHESPKAV